MIEADVFFRIHLNSKHSLQRRKSQWQKRKRLTQNLRQNRHRHQKQTLRKQAADAALRKNNPVF